MRSACIVTADMQAATLYLARAGVSWPGAALQQQLRR